MEKFVKGMLVLNVLIVIGMLSGCNDKTQLKTKDGLHFTIYEVEGCEYLSSAYIFEHKGNCKNPIHIYARKEEEDDVKENREQRRKNKGN